jgi:hypothetical protein
MTRQEIARQYTGRHAVETGQLAKARKRAQAGLAESRRRRVASGEWDRLLHLPQTASNRLKNGQKAVESGQFAEVAVIGRQLGRHVRWHVNRGIKKLSCEFCQNGFVSKHGKSY